MILRGRAKGSPPVLMTALAVGLALVPLTIGAGRAWQGEL